MPGNADEGSPGNAEEVCLEVSSWVTKNKACFLHTFVVYFPESVASQGRWDLVPAYFGGLLVRKTAKYGQIGRAHV